MKSANYAAIDIGSNAMRLLISNVIEKQGKVNFYKNSLIRVPISLGKEVFITQNSFSSKENKREISQGVIKKFIKAMRAYSILMEINDVKHYLAYATSAMREAANSKKICDEIKQQTGIPIEIIDGKTEAELIFQSQLKTHIAENESCIYVDVGGGSTELTFFYKQAKVASKSFPIGTLRIVSQLVQEEDIKKQILPWIEKNCSPCIKNAHLVGTGGNINYTLKQSGKKNYLELEYLKDFYKKLKPMSLQERVYFYQMKIDRAEVITAALRIYIIIMKYIKAQKIHVPKTGVADGMIYKLYEKFPL